MAPASRQLRTLRHIKKKENKPRPRCAWSWKGSNKKPGCDDDDDDDDDEDDDECATSLLQPIIESVQMKIDAVICEGTLNNKSTGNAVRWLRELVPTLSGPDLTAFVDPFAFFYSFKLSKKLTRVGRPPSSTTTTSPTTSPYAATKQVP